MTASSRFHHTANESKTGLITTTTEMAQSAICNIRDVLACMSVVINAKHTDTQADKDACMQRIAHNVKNGVSTDHVDRNPIPPAKTPNALPLTMQDMQCGQQETTSYHPRHRIRAPSSRLRKPTTTASQHALAFSLPTGQTRNPRRVARQSDPIGNDVLQGTYTRSGVPT